MLELRERRCPLCSGVFLLCRRCDPRYRYCSPECSASARRASARRARRAQRLKYEAQLQELALRLQAAEEKNQRALSMARQTKRGHVYIISNAGSFGEEVFKIGLTRRLEPLDRIRELGDASVPFDFDVHALIVSDDAPALERALHRHFLNAQMNDPAAYRAWVNRQLVLDPVVIDEADEADTTLAAPQAAAVLS